MITTWKTINQLEKLDIDQHFNVKINVTTRGHIKKLSRKTSQERHEETCRGNKSSE